MFSAATLTFASVGNSQLLPALARTASNEQVLSSMLFQPISLHSPLHSPYPSPLCNRPASSHPSPPTLPIVDLSNSAQLPVSQSRYCQPGNRASYARSLSSISLQGGCVRWLDASSGNEGLLAPARKQQTLARTDTQSSEPTNTHVQQCAAWGTSENLFTNLPDDSNARQCKRWQQSLCSSSKQQQKQRQDHMHTIFLNAPITSKLHTAPPSTPFSASTSALAPRTPVVIQDVRHQLKHAMEASKSSPSSQIVRIPEVATLRSSALTDPVLKRFAV
jgi:hypothetical protein